MSLGPTCELKKPLKSISNLKNIGSKCLGSCSVEWSEFPYFFKHSYKQREKTAFISILIVSWLKKKTTPKKTQQTQQQKTRQNKNKFTFPLQ